MMKIDRKRKETGERRERGGSFIFILLGNLYYFIMMYVKIETKMLGELYNEMTKYISRFLGCTIELFWYPRC